MKIEISIDESCKEPKIIILTDKITDEINEIVNKISENSLDSMTAFSEKGVEISFGNSIITRRNCVW